MASSRQFGNNAFISSGIGRTNQPGLGQHERRRNIQCSMASAADEVSRRMYRTDNCED
ncbi:hypothetical protein [Paenibacillus sp. AD87]|uniref:hypothetical protein n=1 Tax=Paenibacillus sp. AD87 TaxID=1528787 RepID=UPI0013748381|nr:hypothetical protein [Paenibacillus sp. AD87]